MKRIRKLCLSFAILLFALMTVPMVKTEAAEGVLKEYFPGTQYLPYSASMYGALRFPWEPGDKVSFKNMTPKNLTIKKFGMEYGHTTFLELNMKKNTTGKIKITLKRGGKTYSKTVSVKWYKYPVPKKLTIGGKSCLSKIKTTEYYDNISGYMTGKLSVTPPSGWKLSPKMLVLCETSTGIEVKNISVKSTLPKKCVHLQFSLVNKKNPEIVQTFAFFNSSNVEAAFG